MTVAGVDNNPYFQSISGYLGTVANIEMAKFYTSDLAFMWMGYAGNQSRSYNSVLVEFLFDLYSK